MLIKLKTGNASLSCFTNDNSLQLKPVVYFESKMCLYVSSSDFEERKIVSRTSSRVKNSCSRYKLYSFQS
jgi:hypothetical protein